ncbi:cytochrome b [Marinobacter nanhaiticus D15-8W]|uniref:Cytochrome b n=1 Tax=Marinobacter nanhaiticus D15-8W TaxID=626887 RepID=N6WMW8_9GAMM|nr:cytochrome b [Marinobacter nanhaiticus]ENO12826.2 cytochrome b [Marinobacter nanhaiticus D15-8W]BES70175.1 cytochrome b [Marinobacter nanhaiticus D15-8W]
MQLGDTSERYGTVSRWLHWGMALLFLWQFLSASAHAFLDDTPVEAFFWATHKPLGLLLLILVAIRGIWALANISRRPHSVSTPAKLGHIALYLLMVVIPALALLRQYGSGRAFEPFGLPLMPGFSGEEIGWMVMPANLLHGFLGWTLLALVVGHIVMAWVHRRKPGHVDVFPRMIR